MKPEIDFSQAKRATEFAHLNQLRADQNTTKRDDACNLPSLKSFLQTQQPVKLIIADVDALDELVKTGMMSHLLNLAVTVHLPDMVMFECTADTDTDLAKRLFALLDAGKIKMHETALGEMYRLALQQAPVCRTKTERHTLDWLLDEIDRTIMPTIVVYERGKLAHLINQHDRDAGVCAVKAGVFIEMFQNIT